MNFKVATWIATIGLAVSVATAQAATLTVGPSSPYHTIGAAVGASHNGDTILVYAGTYTESVMINRSVTLIGQGIGDPAITPTSLGPTNRTGDPTREAVVTPALSGVAAFGLYADNIHVSGFTFTGADMTTAAVFASPGFSGAQFTGNAFMHNALGFWLNASGARTTTVAHNVFRDNTTGFGSGGGLGVFSSLGLGNTTFDHNTFSNNPLAGIFVHPTSGAFFNLRITNNVSDSDGNFCDVEGTNHVDIVGNTATNSVRTQVDAGYGSSDLNVSNNILVDGVIGIKIANDGGFAPMRDVDLTNNIIVSEVKQGIIVMPGAVAWGEITGNSCTFNFDGIFIEAGNANISVLNNHMSSNTFLDALDVTFGNRTAGTADTWHGNVGATDNLGGALLH